MTDVEPRVNRREAKHETLDTDLPALLSAVEANQARMDATQERIFQHIRFTRAERYGLLIGVFSVAVTLLALTVTIAVG